MVGRMLVVLNGAPGVGKSVLADRYADEHTLALVIDIDLLRRHLGQWETMEASKQTARDLAVAMAVEHLRGGYDVIIPQYLARRDFVERLRLVAAQADTRFVEVILTDDNDSIIERFRRRRIEYAARGFRHPESDLNDDAVAVAVRAANDGLRRDARAHRLAVIHMGAGIDIAWGDLNSVLAANK